MDSGRGKRSNENPAKLPGFGITCDLGRALKLQQLDHFRQSQ